MLMNLENIYPNVKGVLHIGAHHGQEVRQYINNGITLKKLQKTFVMMILLCIKSLLDLKRRQCK